MNSQSRTFSQSLKYLSIFGAAYLLAHTFVWIQEFSFPPSFDGFYYLVEFRNRIRFHESYFHVWSPYFRSWSFVGGILHFNEMQLFDVAVTVGYCALIFAILHRTRNVLFAVPVLASETLRVFAYSFPRQSLALALVMLGTQCTKKHLSLIVLICASLFHVYAALISGCYLAAQFCCRKPVDARNRFLSLILPSVMLFVACAVYLYLFPRDVTLSTNVSDILELRSGYFSEAMWVEIWFVIAVAIGFIARVSFVRPFAFWNVEEIVSSLLILITVLSLLVLNAEFSLRLLLSVSPIAYGYIVTAKTRTLVRNYQAVAAVSVLATSLATHLMFGWRTTVPGPAMDISSIEKNSSLLSSWIPTDADLRAPHGIQYRLEYFLGRRASDSQSNVNIHTVAINRYLFTPGACTRIALFRADSSPDCLVLEPRWVIRRKITL